MGAVFLGLQPGLDRPVAVKVLRVDRTEEEHLIRFRREAKAMARTQHPNLLQLLDFGIEEGHAYMVLEYLEGRNLAEILYYDGPRELGQSTEIMLDVARALQALHDADIVHRDLKPDNVMVSNQGRVVLMDLGLARFRQKGFTATREGRIVGTVEYMAPEILQGAPPSPASDWYSWGVTGFELLDGNLPFPREQILSTIGDYEGSRWLSPTPPRGTRGPEHFCQLLRWTLAGDPERRPAHADQFDLVLRGKVPAPRFPWALPSETIRAQSTVAELRLRAEPEPAPSKNPRGPLAGILALCVLVGLGFSSFFPGSRPDPWSEVLLQRDPSGELRARVLTSKSSVRSLWIEAPGEPRMEVPLGVGTASPFSASPGDSLRLLLEGGGSTSPRPLPEALDATPELVLETPRFRKLEVTLDGPLPASPRFLDSESGEIPLAIRVLAQNPAAFEVWGPKLARVDALAFGGQAHLARVLPLEAAWATDPKELIERVRADLSTHPNLPTSASRSQHIRGARERWLRLRSMALLDLPRFPAKDRDSFARIFKTFLAKEEGEPYWGTATLLPRDLLELHPESVEWLTSLFPERFAEVLAQADALPSKMAPSMLWLRELAYQGLDPKDRSAQGRFLTRLQESDRSFVENAFRPALLPPLEPKSPFSRKLAWVLWMHWAHPFLILANQGRNPGIRRMLIDVSAVHGETVSSAQEELRLQPFLPERGTLPEAPSESRMKSERQLLAEAFAKLPVPEQRFWAEVLLEAWIPDHPEAPPSRASMQFLLDLLAAHGLSEEPSIRARIRELFEKRAREHPSLDYRDLLRSSGGKW